MDGLDLREYQGEEKEKEMAQLFGRLLSGRSDYETIIDKNPKQIKCPECGRVLDGSEKFCPECGFKVK